MSLRSSRGLCRYRQPGQKREAAMEKGRESSGNLVADMEALLTSGASFDVTIMADGVWLPAHRSVLAARSPVFAAMFRHDVREVSESSVSIPDVHQEVLRQLLHFMYTDKAPLLEVVGPELLVAADKYSVPRLKLQCEQQVIADLCAENAAASAVLAMALSCAKLKVAAISFISAHYQDVMATDGWAVAIREHADDTVEICRLLGKATGLDLECEKETPAMMNEAMGDLAGDLEAMLKSSEGSDVTIKVGEASLAAHRAVLVARSPVLARELKAAPGGVLHMNEVQEADLRQALLYMYSDQLPPPASVTESLLELADNYRLRGLKAYCEEQLAKTISVDNAVSLAVAATKHSWSSLQSACIDFIRRNIFEIMDTAAWETAMRNDVDYMVKISKCLAVVQRNR